MSSGSKKHHNFDYVHLILHCFILIYRLLDISPNITYKWLHGTNMITSLFVSIEFKTTAKMATEMFTVSLC